MDAENPEGERRTRRERVDIDGRRIRFRLEADRPPVVAAFSHGNPGQDFKRVFTTRGRSPSISSPTWGDDHE